MRRGEGEKGRRGSRQIVWRTLACAAFCVALLSSSSPAQNLVVRAAYRAGDFKLVYQKKAADVVISPDDYKVVIIAAHDFAADIERVSGSKPSVSSTGRKPSSNIVLIGTLGKNPLIENLVRSNKLDVRGLTNKWESFLIATVRNPMPGVEQALVVIGSDRRGTAFGIYELSQRIGVSPWVWWADVVPDRKANLLISGGRFLSGEPSVKYRGIFINDEDWGLEPWAAKNFEPESGNIGPRTYAKVFELLLRLKANMCWPAMHEVTRPFNGIAENAKVADDYAIVMGSSHAEPMLRNNVGEWKDDKEKYNFVSNPAGVTRYWEDRLKTNGKFENVYTLGMRGIHDSPIQGTKNQTDRIPALEKIISTQRSLLTQYVGDPEKIPQIFCPYKEVLADYKAGLKVPDDVTLVFPDDNFGYIRYFPSAEEQKRKGGFGVYYHISYLGRPISYVWLETTPPAQIWEEMSKAYDHDMRKFWVLNVGDIKPGEIGIEFFMQMAWDINKWKRDNSKEFLKTWAAREFGTSTANEVADILDDYYRLGFARKPEHLQWNIPGEPAAPSNLSGVDYGDEMETRLERYQTLMERADKVYNSLPPAKKDAFFELVLYPVRGAALANTRFFAVEKSVLYAKQGRASTTFWVDKVVAADAAINRETAFYNDKVAGGKWRGIMSPEMNKGQWPSMRSTPPAVPDSVRAMKFPEPAGLGIAVEGRDTAVGPGETVSLPPFTGVSGETRFIDVFDTGQTAAAWVARTKQTWIKRSEISGYLATDRRIIVSVDMSRFVPGKEMRGEIDISGAGSVQKIEIIATRPKLPSGFQGFVESNGVISIEAEHFDRNPGKNGAAWQVINGLGRSGDSVAVFPTTTPSVDLKNLKDLAPVLEYKLYASSTGDFGTTAYLIPTQPIKSSTGLRYAIAVDDGEPQIVTVGAETEVSSRQWSLNVLNQVAIGVNKLKISSGAHLLKVYMVDAGVILDKIVINTGGERKSYLGPAETRITTSKNKL